MLLEVYDKETLNRVDIIRTYTFVQYTDYFNDVGTFSIKVPVNEPSLKHLMIQGNYILFEKLGDKFEMGIVKYFHKEGIETPTVEIKGYMLPHILTYRCFRTTYQKTGQVFEIQRDFIQRFFINTDDIRRQIDLMMISDTYDRNTEKIRYCQTGSDCAESLTEMNAPYHYGYGLVPAIAKYDPETGREQNIMRFTFEQYTPTDRRVGNKDGNDPVVFDTELNNVEDVMYEIDGTKAKTVAVVGGEGEGEDRYVIETGDDQLSGIDRNELYVDARDLQMEEEEATDYMTYDDTILLLNQMYPDGIQG